MKIMERLLCVSIAILLMCASLTACAPRPQEELTDLDLIKAEWQRYVVDRTEEVNDVTVGGQWSPSVALRPIFERSVINEVLNICQTLDSAKLTASEGRAVDGPMYDLAVILALDEYPASSYIYINIYKDGQAYVSLIETEEQIEKAQYWAYISNWSVYEQLNPYIDYWKNKES